MNSNESSGFNSWTRFVAVGGIFSNDVLLRQEGLHSSLNVEFPKTAWSPYKVLMSIVWHSPLRSYYASSHERKNLCDHYG